MKKVINMIVGILLGNLFLSATPIWHQADSLLISPMEDSVAYMEEICPVICIDA